MTDRPRPVGSSGGAEAFLVCMSVEITHDDVIGDVAGCRREVAPLREPLTPVPLANVFKLLLDPVVRETIPLCETLVVRDPAGFGPAGGNSCREQKNCFAQLSNLR